MISDTKMGNSFTISQFTMTGYPIPFRLDQTSHRSRTVIFEQR